jgi:phage terminase large subunit-like protein
MLLIEDAVSGRELIQLLRSRASLHVPDPIARPATTHKEVRAWGQTALVERGDLLLPKEAPWLASFLHELLGFPKARNDDQVDAIVHLLEWWSTRMDFTPENSAPEIVHIDDPYEYDGDFTEDPWEFEGISSG